VSRSWQGRPRLPFPAKPSISSCSTAENEMEVHMTIIKLKKYYPYLQENITLEVSDEIAVTLSVGGCQCDSYKRRKRDHGECSLDAVHGFGADSVFPALTPEEVMENEELQAALYAAIDKLPPVQARRVYAHYILGISITKIAQADGVDKSRVSHSLDQGLKNLEKILKNFFSGEQL